MTDAEIIKALECHNLVTVSKCEQCPLFPTSECSAELSGYALDLIKRYKTKDEQLDKAIQQLELEIMRMKNNAFCNVVIDEEAMRSIINEKVQEFELNIETIKAEAIKEFAEKLKLRTQNLARMEYGGYTYFCVGYDLIDTLVKEMVGDAE